MSALRVYDWCRKNYTCWCLCNCIVCVYCSFVLKGCILFYFVVVYYLYMVWLYIMVVLYCIVFNKLANVSKFSSVRILVGSSKFEPVTLCSDGGEASILPHNALWVDWCFFCKVAMVISSGPKTPVAGQKPVWSRLFEMPIFIPIPMLKPQSGLAVCRAGLSKSRSQAAAASLKLSQEIICAEKKLY